MIISILLGIILGVRQGIWFGDLFRRFPRRSRNANSRIGVRCFYPTAIELLFDFISIVALFCSPSFLLTLFFFLGGIRLCWQSFGNICRNDSDSRSFPNRSSRFLFLEKRPSCFFWIGTRLVDWLLVYGLVFIACVERSSFFIRPVLFQIVYLAFLSGTFFFVERLKTLDFPRFAQGGFFLSRFLWFANFCVGIYLILCGLGRMILF